MKRNDPPAVLTIAGSDSSGGAGIQADLKTMTALNAYGMSVITALTAQNTQGVQAILPIETSFVKQQLTSIISDIPPKAIKIGMLHDSDLIELVSDFISANSLQNIVVDPVMVATSGDRLLNDSALNTLMQSLLGLATLITPNRYEAEIIWGKSIRTLEDMEFCAKDLSNKYNTAVLVKGGDLDHQNASDVLALENQVKWFSGQRIKTKNSHGTGCTLSSAIASYLAHGNSITKSIQQGKKYIENALKAGSAMDLGKGRGPVNHMYNIKGV